MMPPKIGEEITTERALGLCRHYRFDHLVKRIEEQPDSFKSWKFDGASMIPDKIFSKLFEIPNLTEIALRHDLKYAYGEPGNKKEKLKADLEFELEVLDDGASYAIAKLMFSAVDVFGEGFVRTSFSWGFARR